MSGKAESKRSWTIRCDVSPGMFSNERGVRLSLPGGRVLSLIVDEKQVIVSGIPKTGKTIPGHLKVVVVNRGAGKALLDLPQASFSEGRRVEVPEALLEATAA